MKKVYPALFHPDEGGYYVTFPDLKGCVTEGDDLAEAIEMASEALGLYLASEHDRGIASPAPSDITDVDAGDGFASYVTTNVGRYLKSGKAIKKTLTIPEWLNVEAERAGVNFSAILQEALKKQLAV
jgi:predicted RNase H-like HicB family nuclease